MAPPIRSNGPVPTPHLQPSFTGGELAPNLYARVDLARWHVGAKTMRNFYPLAQGGAVNRPGTQFIGYTKYGLTHPEWNVRLLPFVFNSDQTYILEFGQFYIRVLYRGALLTEIWAPYGHDDLAQLKYAQSNDILTLTHPSYSPRELRRYGHAAWTLATLGPGTQLSAPYNCTVTPVQPGGAPSGASTKDFRYAVTAVRLNPADESVLSNPATCANFDLGYNQQFGIKNTIAWAAVGGADYYNVYRHFQGVWAFIGSTAATSLDDMNTAPDTTTTPATFYNPFPAAGVAAVTVTNGGSGYSGTTQLLVQDATGSGAVLSPIIVGGEIVAVSVVQPGGGYSNPSIVIADPAAGGTGAVLSATLNTGTVDQGGQGG